MQLMKHQWMIILFTTLFFYNSNAQNKIADPQFYLAGIKADLNKQWPDNRTINLVFHGHSVPAGFFKTPVVNTLSAYPYLLLEKLKAKYPYAVINVINTSIGGENSESGEKRFDSEVLTHRPDVLFIDYALNDTGLGLEKSKGYWNRMIQRALENKIKIILLTPSPDQRVNILEPDNILEQHTQQIEQLAKDCGIGLVDSYSLFKDRVISGDSVSIYMSQVNHPNRKGHLLITEEIVKYF